MEERKEGRMRERKKERYIERKKGKNKIEKNTIESIAVD